MEEEHKESAPIKSDNIASQLIVEDYLKKIQLKTKNVNYKPWKSKEAPRNPHSPFGDFPKSYLPKKKSKKKRTTKHQDS